MCTSKWTYLDETDGGRLFTEALTAEVKTILANETGLVSAETAEKERKDIQSTVLSKERSPGAVFTIHGCPCRTCGDERTR